MGAEGWRTQDGRDRVLSERQRQVLDLLAQGHTNAEIGDALGMTLDGAKWHVSEIISKLGVANREEAAALWRRDRRTRWLPRSVDITAAWRWLLAGTGIVAGTAVTVVVVIAMVRGDGADSPASHSPLATVNPPSAPLSAEEILHRSEQAMATIPIFRVETATWPERVEEQERGVDVWEYAGTDVRFLNAASGVLSHCPDDKVAAPAFSRRSLGALAAYPERQHQDRGATKPDTFELLGEQTIDGEEAWVIRYAFTYPSIESPIRVEDTEWIAKTDYRLLRQDRESRDAFGFVGQIVSVVEPVEAPSTECPAAPIHSVEDLSPLTTPRLTTQ